MLPHLHSKRTIVFGGVLFAALAICVRLMLGIHVPGSQLRILGAVNAYTPDHVWDDPVMVVLGTGFCARSTAPSSSLEYRLQLALSVACRRPKSEPPARIVLSGGHPIVERTKYIFGLEALVRAVLPQKLWRHLTRGWVLRRHEMSEADVMEAWINQNTPHDCQVELIKENNSTSTRTNAVSSLPLIVASSSAPPERKVVSHDQFGGGFKPRRPTNTTHVVLCTSSFHQSRSERTFVQAVSEMETEHRLIVSVAVDPHVVEEPIRQLVFVRELLANLLYIARGWASLSLVHDG